MAATKIDLEFKSQLATLDADNADSIVFNLGRPSNKVLSAGVADRPLKLYGNKLLKKMRKHGFDVNDIKGLPKAVRNPIAVFKNLEAEGEYSILTALKTKQGNILVAVGFGTGTDADVSIVRTIFGKAPGSVVRWINEGKLRYVDKNKARRYLHLVAPIATASNGVELYSATKIINNFHNANIPWRNLQNVAT